MYIYIYSWWYWYWCLEVGKKFFEAHSVLQSQRAQALISELNPGFKPWRQPLLVELTLVCGHRLTNSSGSMPFGGHEHDDVL